MRFLRLLPGLLLGAAIACGGGGGTEPPPGDDGGLLQAEGVTVDGQQRFYTVFVPGGLPSQNLSLLIALHGQGSLGAEMLKTTGLDLLADSLGMVVVFPDALQRSWSLQDTAFFDVLRDSLAVRHGTVSSGVHVLGFSQGGTMAQILACRRAGSVRSIMVHGVSLDRETAAACTPSAPTHAFFLLGTQDVLAPWSPTQDALGGEGSAEWWSEANGCEAEPERVDNDDTIRLNWDQCNGGARVRMIAVYGGGHLFFPISNFNTLGELADWLSLVS